MVRSKVASKPPATKPSFMIDDLLRTSHVVDRPCATDRSCNPTAGGEMNTSEAMSTPAEDRATHGQLSQVPKWSLSADQERILDKAFSLQPYPNKKQRQQLATEIDSTQDRVKLWFRKRRVTLRNQLSHNKQRTAKLAYLNSLAHSLVPQPQQPKVLRCSPSTHLCYRPAPYFRVGVVPSLYSSSRRRQSSYTVPPSYSVNGWPYCYGY